MSALPGHAAPAVPLLGRGVVLHRRLRPRVNAFRYGTAFLMLPMRGLAAAGAGARAGAGAAFKPGVPASGSRSRAA